MRVSDPGVHRSLQQWESVDVTDGMRAEAVGFSKEKLELSKSKEEQGEHMPHLPA